MKRDFQGGIPKTLTDVPPRLFDLIPLYINRYSGRHDCLFGGKVNGKWMKYDGKTVKEVTDNISFGLLKLGVKRDDKIALIANNCPEWNMIDLAAQQIGAICVPIYPTISQSDYEYIFNHSEAKIIFISGRLIYNKITSMTKDTSSIGSLFSIKPVEGVRHLDELIELGKANQDRAALDAIEASIKTDDIATIIYTSGTLGQPKGVMLSHKNILSMIRQLHPVYPIDETHDQICYLPLSHIYERTINYGRIFLGTATYYVENIGRILQDIQEIKPKSFSSVPRMIEKIYSGIMRKGLMQKGLQRNIFKWAMSLAERFDETRRSNGFFYRKKLRLADMLVYGKIRQMFGGRLELIIVGGAAIQPRLVKIFGAIGIPLIEGYGLTETSPVVATNSIVTGKLKAGTVGEPLSAQTVRIAENGEILVKGDNVFAGYYKDEEKTREAIDADGFFHTGDIGEFDEDGMLKITGRIKDIFKTSMGKYVSPALLESKVCESPFVSQMLIVGENQKFAGALIVPSFDYVKAWCEENGIACKSNKEMIKNHEVINCFRNEIAKYNKEFGDYEQIKRFELIDHEWSIEAGEMTPSLKLKRNVIIERHAAEIGRIFSE
ncbi:MAG: long-chain fatty acid--CoA ligase [Bacteroidales bacterium]|nr:long-chain fatty acid--CoA ligase [Bacteroidales bacterium]